MTRKIELYSFGYARSGMPPQALFVTDCRVLPNPHNQEDLRHMTGKDMEVKEFLTKSPKTAQLVGEGLRAAQGFDRIAFGCHGGRHRSVAIAEMVADRLRDEDIEVEVHHLELAR